jgi:Holliday junction resolvasome RuvABC endonuclease subunit
MVSATSIPLYTVCGIDPGTNSLGVGLLTVHAETLELISGSSRTFTPTLLEDDLIRTSHNERFEKILNLKAQLERFFDLHRPDVVCSESPFYHRLHPGAYGPLVEVIYAVRLAVVAYSPHVKFLTYEPRVVKLGAGASPNAKKPEMKEKITGNPEIRAAVGPAVDGYDEHSIDALAVGYTHLRLLRKYQPQR